MYMSESDIYLYWGGCIVTYLNNPYRVMGATPEGLQLSDALHPEGLITVPLSEVNTHIPPLGWVRVGTEWVYLYRVPARRVKKGYCQESIGCVGIGGAPHRVDVYRAAVINQLWKKPRKHPEILELDDGRKFYGTDLVMNNGQDVVGKEKLSGYVRSLCTH